MVFSMHSLAGLAAVLPGALAAFDAVSLKNVAVSWAQDTQSLPSTCSNMDIDIVTLAATTRGDSDMGEQITSCQEDHNTTVLLSLDGSFFDNAFPSAEEAKSAAQRVWGMFGPSKSDADEERPFGRAVIDGFNLALDATTQNLEAFAKELRSIMDASVVADDRPFLLSTDQDGSSESVLDRLVSLDFIVAQLPSNEAVAGELRRSETTKTLMKLAGSNIEGLSQAISQASKSISFGGVMIDTKDPSVLEKVTEELDAAHAAPTATMPAPTAPAIVRRHGQWAPGGAWNTTMITLPNPYPTGTGAPAPPHPTGHYEVPPFGQCGGHGYHGPTKCKAPLTCVYKNEMWSSCRPERSHRVFDVDHPGHGSPV